MNFTAQTSASCHFFVHEDEFVGINSLDGIRYFPTQTYAITEEMEMLMDSGFMEQFNESKKALDSGDFSRFIEI